jgi:hypothetical protein
VSFLDVQLYSDQTTLQAWTNQEGRFIFDGLAAGDYHIELPTETRKIHLEPKDCKSEWFYVPRNMPKK